MFTLLEKEDLRPGESVLLQTALDAAVRMQTAPDEFQVPGYQSGDGAWAWWLAGIDKGLGTSHGHWWSAMVWKECRAMAAEFFAGLEPAMPGAKAAGLYRDLAGLYRDCSAQLDIAKDKEAPAETQKAALAAGRDLDRRCTGLIRELQAALVS
jgi:hypothetical protein